MDQTTITNTSTSTVPVETIENPGVFIGMLILLGLVLGLAITDCYLFKYLWKKIRGNKEKYSDEEATIETGTTTEKVGDSRNAGFVVPMSSGSGGGGNAQISSQPITIRQYQELAAAGPNR